MKKAFTLAEALITIAIIGIVAALTLPSVISNYEDKKYNTARLKALKTFGESAKMISINNKMNSEDNAKDFANNVLSKYLKIVKVCDTALECDFPDKIKPSNPASNKLTSDELNAWNKISIYNFTVNNLTQVSESNLSTYIMTNDGFSAKIFYNPSCVRDTHENTTCTSQECATNFVDDTCLNVIYDMNGTDGPNHVGDDIGIVTTFWSGLNASSAAPGIAKHAINSTAQNLTHSEALDYCASKSTKNAQYSIPNIDELTSLFVNQKFTSIFGSYSQYFWSGSVVSGMPDKIWCAYGYSDHMAGSRTYIGSQGKGYTWCVRR